MVVLVTGGAGFIGFNLINRLLKESQKIVVIDDLSAPKSAERLKLIKNKIQFIKQDIREPIKVDNIDKIFHLAAQTSVGYSFQEPALDASINMIGTVRALEAARKNDCPLVFASSSTVYGDAKIPTPETAPLNPISFYGLSKLCGEQYCKLYLSQYNIQITIFRIFNVYGPWAVKGVIPDFNKKLNDDSRVLKMLGSGQEKDFIYVDDVVDAFVASKPGIFNLGSGEKTSIVDLAQMIISARGLKTKIESGYENWLGDVPITMADINKIKKDLGWRPKTSMKEGVRKTIEHLQARK